MVVIMKLLQESRFFQKIPFTALGPGEEFDDGFFCSAFPDLRDDHITAEYFEGLHSEVAVEENKVHFFSHHDHGDDLTDTTDGCGEYSNALGPLNSRMGIAKLKPGKFDFFDRAKLFTLHAHLTPDGGIALPDDPRIRKNGIVPLQPTPWHAQ